MFFFLTTHWGSTQSPHFGPKHPPRLGVALQPPIQPGHADLAEVATVHLSIGAAMTGQLAIGAEGQDAVSRSKSSLALTKATSDWSPLT